MILSRNIGHLQRMGRSLFPVRSCTTTSTPPKSSLSLLMQILDEPRRSEIRRTVGPLTTIEDIHLEDLQNTYDFLTSLNYQLSDIRKQPKILLKHVRTIQNNYNIFLEAGFQQVRLSDLNHYLLIVNKRVEILKTLLLIPRDTNVAERLSNFIKVDITDMEFKESEKLREFRFKLINEFLVRYFGVTDTECQRIWKSYTNLRHKSLGSIYTAVEQLQTELNFDKERIIKHSYLLYSDPENTRKILSETTLGGLDTKELLWKRPKILMSSYTALMKIQEHLRTLEIPDSAVSRCPEIFTLSPDTIYDRLMEMRKTKEFSVLVHHPRVLRLVQYHSKASARVEYLRKMKVNCVSLHVLSSSSGYFEKYTRTGVDRTKCGDILTYLSTIFGKPMPELRARLSRHPNFCHVPAPSVKQTLEFLLDLGFNLENIQQNIFLILYPVKRIEEQFSVLRMTNNKLGVVWDELTPNQRLQLCLYLIEIEFHFAGDGIWEHPLQVSDCAGPDAAAAETEAQMLGNYRSSTHRKKRQDVVADKLRESIAT